MFGNLIIMGSSQESYVIEGGTAGRERLRVLSAAMRPLTESFLDRLNITPGMRCLDVGCGGGDVTRMLARRCGTSGAVVGIDMDAAVIAIAREESTALESANSEDGNDVASSEAGDDVANTGAGNAIAIIEFSVADATTFHSAQPFDLIYARFFLSHTTDARAAIQHLKTLLRPGGTLAVEDVWFPGHFAFPQSEAFDTYVRWYREAAQQHGADPGLGIMLPTLFEELGLQNIHHEMHSQAFGSGPNKEVSLITLERIRHAVVQAAISSEEEVARVIEELRAFTMRADTVVSMAPVVQISARA